MKGRILGIGLLIIWGLIKMPIETYLTARREQQQLAGFKIQASLRQQAGQAGFVAALGGLRAAVADLLWIRAHIAWQDREYGRMKLYFDVITALQPRREMFWDIAAWHMAWNGAAYMEQTIVEPVERQRRMQEYYNVGEDYLLQGVKNAPGSWVLYERLAAFYHYKARDYCKAAEAYSEAAKRPGHLPYVRRFAVYALADCPGHEKEAYEKLKALYQEGEQEWLPTLLKKIQEVEGKLGIPKENRLDIPPENRRLPH
jgi:hypothetical protein